MVCAVTLLTICISSIGCSFDRRWRAMSREAWAKPSAVASTPAPADAPTDAPANASEIAPASASAEPLAGRWEGTWKSDQNGHSGRLRAIVDRVDANTYRIEYDGWFFGILRYTHGMNVTATPAPDGGTTIRFNGEEDLGALAGGVFRYDGTADGAAFKSTYQSKDDHGRFEMKRPTE
jgi:hypothetical protein